LSNFWDEEDKPTAQPQAVQQPQPKAQPKSSFWDEEDQPAAPAAPKAKTEGSLSEHLDSISKKYNVNPEILRKYALDIGSQEAAKDVLEKGKAVLGAATESMFMGLPGKLERKVTAAAGKGQYEQALDEVTSLVNERKTGTQKVGEFAAGMLLPSTGVAKTAGLLGKVATGVGLGAATGAAAGLGGSKAGEEVPAMKTGAAVGSMVGAGGGLLGAGIQRALPETKELAQKLIKPKAKEAAEMLIKGEEAKIPRVVEGVIDYTRRQVAEGQKVKPIFKATSREGLIRNINDELTKVGGAIDDEIQINLVEKNTGTIYENLTKRINELQQELETKLETGAISRKEYTQAQKTLQERVVSNIIPFGERTGPDVILQRAINVRRGLQDAAKRAYEPGKQLTPSDQLMKDMATKLNDAIYESMPSDRLQRLNRDYSNLIYYRDALARGESKQTIDKLYQTLATGAFEAAANIVLPSRGVVTAGKVVAELAATDMGRLIRLQVGETKAKQILQEAADRAVRESTKGIAK